jgi:hypothetical protein
MKATAPFFFAKGPSMATRDRVICSHCGWIEPLPSTASTVAKGALGATKALVRTSGRLGTGVGIIMKGLGIAFIIIGIPLVFFAGMGFVVMGFGVILWLASIFFRKGGRMVTGSMGATPKTCPSCAATDLIPVTSPVAKRLMADLGLATEA